MNAVKSTLALVLLAALPAALGACCSNTEARFWKLRDPASGAIVYAVDTAGAPLEAEKFEPTFVDASGRECSLARRQVVAQISEAEFTSATGGAGYGVHYCGQMKTCWARPYAK